ncbi:hypothetical protein CIPAW_03G271500 [Carya illinoinensis]|uniref:Uncharacterized protein n=1 Tax=Carya illinoinensis TaxID=32201 RepID=A0A8T1R632_CARIL|nr:hypothetical protein CIPAW_03G271500 [Carya illinoinensis]
MAPEAMHSSFEHVNLKGRNIGAAMFMPNGDTRGESHDCCCINIYINNNIQGVNNSILHGSEVKLRDPGVSLFFGDVKLDRGSKTNKKRVCQENNILGRKHRQFPHTDTSTPTKSTRRNLNGYRHRTNSQRTSLTCAPLLPCYNPADSLPPSLPVSLSLSLSKRGYFRKSSSFSSYRISICSCISAIFCENLLDPVLAGLAPTVDKALFLSGAHFSPKTRVEVKC